MHCEIMHNIITWEALVKQQKEDNAVSKKCTSVS